MDVTIPDGLPVWLTGGVVGLLFASHAFPNILGPVSRALSEWADRRREAAVARDDADIAELRRERDYLAGRAAAQHAELTERDRLNVAHRAWDYEALEAARCGRPLPPPPPLWPTSAAANPPKDEGDPS